MFEERWESLGGQMLRSMGTLWAETAMDASPAPPPALPALDKLSQRELEIFELLGRGHAASDIATLLGVSPNTIQTHRLRIREKLGLDNAKQVAIQAALWISGIKDGRRETGDGRRETGDGR
jgi:DNA-binding NarL/FixJ family response regulator